MIYLLCEVLAHFHWIVPVRIGTNVLDKRRTEDQPYHNMIGLYHASVIRSARYCCYQPTLIHFVQFDSEVLSAAKEDAKRVVTFDSEGQCEGSQQSGFFQGGYITTLAARSKFSRTVLDLELIRIVLG